MPWLVATLASTKTQLGAEHGQQALTYIEISIDV